MYGLKHSFSEIKYRTRRQTLLIRNPNSKDMIVFEPSRRSVSCVDIFRECGSQMFPVLLGLTPNLIPNVLIVVCGGFITSPRSGCSSAGGCFGRHMIGYKCGLKVSVAVSRQRFLSKSYYSSIWEVYTVNWKSGARGKCSPRRNCNPESPGIR